MSVKVRQLLLASGRYSVKSPYAMTPKGIVFHNTAGTASAMAEASYMSGNNLNSSMHLYVDESEAVQTLPFNRNAWHATDGSTGYANRNLIGLEVCRSRSALATFKKAEENAIEVCAVVLLQLGLPANSSTIRWHREFVSTACPHRTSELGDRTRVITAIQAKMAMLGGKTEKAEGGIEYMKVLKITGAAKGINVQGFGDFKTSAVAADNLQDGYYAVNADKVSSNEGYSWCVIYYPPLGRTLAMPYGGVLSDRCALLDNQEPMDVIPVILKQHGVGAGIAQEVYDKEVAARKAAETKLANGKTAADALLKALT